MPRGTGGSTLRVLILRLQNWAGHSLLEPPLFLPAGWGCAQVLGFQNPHSLQGSEILEYKPEQGQHPGQPRGKQCGHSGTGEPSLLRWPRESRLQGAGGLGGRRWVVWTGGSCGQRPGVRQTQTLPLSEASSLLTRSANESGL